MVNNRGIKKLINIIKLNVLSYLIMILGAYKDTDIVFICKVMLLLLFLGYTVLSIIMTFIYFPI